MFSAFTRFFILFIPFSLFYACAGSDNSPENGSLAGIVTDKVTGAPLRSAVVGIEPNQATGVTDLDGKYQLKSIIAGDYTVSVNVQGYRQILVDSVTIEAGREFELNGALLLDNYSGSIVSDDLPGTVNGWQVEILESYYLNVEWLYDNNVMSVDPVWTSSDETMAAISQQGLLQPLQEWNVVIKAVSAVNDTALFLTMAVLTNGDIPHEVDWFVAEQASGGMNSQGEFFPVTAGTTTLIPLVTTHDTAGVPQCSVEVVGVDSVAGLPDTLAFWTGDSARLNAVVYYTDGTSDSDVVWFANDVAYMHINHLPMVSAIQAGKVTVSAISRMVPEVYDVSQVLSIGVSAVWAGICRMAACLCRRQIRVTPE